MKIHHFAMYVKDLEKTREFYEKYFGAKANELYYNPKSGLKTYFLTFASGVALEIMTKPGVASAAFDHGEEYTGYIHLALAVGAKESVDELTKRLREDGYGIISEPRTTGDGYYESCVKDPEGNRIEIVAG